jgi:4-methylaminobutanoate oxidase (formaldehyde-forming)
MLNSRGGIECDLTAARLADDRYYIVTGTGFRTHDLAWIRQNLPAGLDATITDVTEDWGTLSLMGPRARDPGRRGARTGIPFGRARDRRCRASVRALRDLRRRTRLEPIPGWTGAVFDALMEAGGGQASGRRLSRSRCGWKRATAPGPPTSPRTTRRSRRAWAGR